jgi:iron complex outermembrane receptor protein
MALAILSATGAVFAEGQTHHINIAPQSVSDALKTLAAETHIQIFSDGEALKGKKTKGIQGDFTAKEALQKLLAGTGLTYTFTADDAVAVKAADLGSDASILPAVEVTGKAQLDPTDPYNTDYSLKKSSTATKTDTPLMETPVSVQIVSQQLMKDQQTIRLEDALKNVSGVRREVTYGSANIYESFTMRGFDSQGAVYRNGIRLYEQTFETANLQQIEVLKGPASVLYGRTEPGGPCQYHHKKTVRYPLLCT